MRTPWTLPHRISILRRPLAFKASTSARGVRVLSYLELAQGVDAVPYDSRSYKHFFRRYYKFRVAGHKHELGYVPEDAVNQFSWHDGWAVDNVHRDLVLQTGDGAQTRSEAFRSTLQRLSDSGVAPSLDKPGGEMLPIFGRGREHLLDIDRVAAIYFGTVSYGVQMLAYTRTAQSTKYWVPRRSQTKRSYPGKLDNCVGGALNSGETPLLCLTREASEEASLPGQYVRQHAKPFGVVSYHMATNGNGQEGHQPQVMHVYHIELTEDVVPRPSDGEVERFELMTLNEVQTALKNGEFKTNCAATWLSYMIATGIINDENEPDLYEIQTHLHRRLNFPTR